MLEIAKARQSSLTVFTDGFLAYRPLDEDDAIERRSVCHGDGEYVDGTDHINIFETQAALVRAWRKRSGTQAAKSAHVITA